MWGDFFKILAQISLELTKADASLASTKSKHNSFFLYIYSEQQLTKNIKKSLYDPAKFLWSVWETIHVKIISFNGWNQRFLKKISIVLLFEATTTLKIF